VKPADDSGFLSRWSRRKVLTRAGDVVEPIEAPAAPPPEAVPAAPAPPALAAPPDEPASAPPPPTLHDVSLLTRDADFSRFVAPGVDGGVRNAALHKLFSDPHFNVMDGLDTYIDDYGKPDPLPLSMLRKMAQAHVLGLFQGEEDGQAAAPRAPTESPVTDEDPDLRLQPHDAAGRARAEPGAGEDAGGEC
jgi:hypothetical protein